MQFLWKYSTAPYYCSFVLGHGNWWSVQSLGGETPPTTKIVRYSFNVSSQNDISEHRRHSWCFFCCIFFLCGLQSKTYSCAKAEPKSKQKMVGEEARGERQWEPLAPSPIIFFFILGSAFMWLNLLLYEPHQKKKKQPAMQATLKISLMSWTCQGMNIGMYHLNFELFLPPHPKSPPPRPLWMIRFLPLPHFLSEPFEKTFPPSLSFCRTLPKQIPTSYLPRTLIHGRTGGSK